MKYLSVVLFTFLAVLTICGCLFFGESKSDAKTISNIDYLRLHIRANSNSDEDQEVKYYIKDELLNYLTLQIATLETKKDLENFIINNRVKIQNFVDNILEEKGFNYISNIKINNEYFPSRTYNNLTLESGFYDAIIVELGSAEGNNWWCVAYPPLCFMYESDNFGNITYKSILLEIINKFFK